MPETIVTIEFRAMTGGTEIMLRQEVLEIPMCTRQLSGWLAACGRLTALVEVRTTLNRHGLPRKAANRPEMRVG